MAPRVSLPTNPGAGYAEEQRARARAEMQKLLGEPEAPPEPPAPEPEEEFVNPFKSPPPLKYGPETVSFAPTKEQARTARWREAADAGGGQGMHERIGRVLKDVFQRDPVTGTWPSGPGLAQAPGHLREAAGATKASYTEALESGQAAVSPTGRREPFAPAWSVMSSVAGGAAPRDRALAQLKPEEREQYKLFYRDQKGGFHFNPGYFPRAIHGTEAVPPVGWTPERHGMDPVSYLLNVGAESAGRVAGFTGGAAAFMPAFIGEAIGNTFTALTGYDVQDAFNLIEDSTQAYNPDSPPQVREAAIKRLQTREELNGLTAQNREAKKREAFEALKRSGIDFALFPAHTLQAFIEDPLGSAATKLGDMIASYHMTKEGVAKVGRGAGAIEQLAREKREAGLQREMATRPTGESPLAERPKVGEQLFPTTAERDIEIANVEKALIEREQTLRRAGVGGELREPGTGRIYGLDPRTVDSNFKDDPMPSRRVTSAAEQRELELDREAWVKRNRPRLEELRRTTEHKSPGDARAIQLRAQLDRLTGEDMLRPPQSGEVDLYHVIDPRGLGEFRATGELPKSPRPMTTTDPAVAAQMARDAGPGHFVVWMRGKRTRTLRSGFREQKGRPGVYWVRRKTRPQTVDPERVRVFRAENWDEAFKTSPAFKTLVERKGAIERASGAVRRSLENVAHAPLARLSLAAASDIARRNRYFDRYLTGAENWAKETLGPKFDEFRIQRTISGLRRDADRESYNTRNRQSAELESLVRKVKAEAPGEFDKILDIMWAKDPRPWKDLSPATQNLLQWWHKIGEQSRMEHLESGELSHVAEWLRRYQPLRMEQLGAEREQALQKARELERTTKPIRDWFDRVTAEPRRLYQSGREKGRMGALDKLIEADKARRDAAKQAGELVRPATEEELQREFPLGHDAKWWRDQLVAGYRAEAESKGVPAERRTTMEQFHLSALLAEIVARAWAKQTGRTVAEYFSNIYGATAGWAHVEGQAGKTLYQRVPIPSEQSGLYSRLEAVSEQATAADVGVANKKAIASPDAILKALERAGVRSAKEGGETFSKTELEATSVKEFLHSYATGRKLFEDAINGLRDYYEYLSAHEVDMVNSYLHSYYEKGAFARGGGVRAVGLHEAAPGIHSFEGYDKASRAVTVAAAYSDVYGRSWAENRNQPLWFWLQYDKNAPGGFVVQMPPEGPSLSSAQHWIKANRPKIEEMYLTQERGDDPTYEGWLAVRRDVRDAYDKLQAMAEKREAAEPPAPKSAEPPPEALDPLRDLIEKLPDEMLSSRSRLNQAAGPSAYLLTGGSHIATRTRSYLESAAQRGDALDPGVMRALLVSGMMSHINKRTNYESLATNEERAGALGAVIQPGDIASRRSESRTLLEDMLRSTGYSEAAAYEAVRDAYLGTAGRLIAAYRRSSQPDDPRPGVVRSAEAGELSENIHEQRRRVFAGDYAGAPLPDVPVVGAQRGFTMSGGTDYQIRAARYLRNRSMAYAAKAVELAVQHGRSDWVIDPADIDPNAPGGAEFTEAWKGLTRQFDSGHWRANGPDIAEHFRSTVRRVRGGSNLLFVEEIQADPLQSQGGAQLVTPAEFREAKAKASKATENLRAKVGQVAERVRASLSEAGLLTPDVVAEIDGAMAPMEGDYFDAGQKVSYLHNIEVAAKRSAIEDIHGGPELPEPGDPDFAAKLAAAKYAAEASSETPYPEAVVRTQLQGLHARELASLFSDSAALDAANETIQRQSRARSTFPWDKGRAYEDLQVYRILDEAYKTGAPGVSWLPGAMQAFRNSHLATAPASISMRRPTAGEIAHGADPASWVVVGLGSGGRFEPGGESSYDVDLEKLARMIDAEGAAVGAPTAFAFAKKAAENARERAAALWQDPSGKDPLERLQAFEDELRAAGELPEPKTEAVTARPEPTPVQALAKMKEGFLAKGKPWTPEFEAKQRATYERKTGKSWAELEAEPQPPHARLAAEEEAWAPGSTDNAIKLFWLRKQAEEYRELAADAQMDRSASYEVAKKVIESAEELLAKAGGAYKKDGEPRSVPVPTNNITPKIAYFGGAGSKDYMDKQIANRMLQLAKRVLLENGAPKAAVEAVKIRWVEVDYTPTPRLATPAEIGGSRRRAKAYVPVDVATAAMVGGDYLSTLKNLLESAGYASLRDWFSDRGAVEIASGRNSDIAIYARESGLLHTIYYNEPDAPRPGARQFISVPAVMWGADLTQYLRRVPLMQREAKGGRYGRHGGVKGAVEFLNDGRAVQRMLASTDVTTLVHEGAHIFRRFLAPSLLAKAEAIYGVRDGVWTIPQEERFATNFERYMMMGQSPSRELAPVFRRFAAWLSAIYTESYADGHLGKVSPAVRKLFAEMLGVDPVGEQVGPQGHEPFDVPYGTTFGDQMKAARNRFNMTIEEAASRTDIPAAKIDAIESGRETASEVNAAKLAVTYGLDPDSAIEELHRPRPKRQKWESKWGRSGWTAPGTPGATSVPPSRAWPEPSTSMTAPRWMREDIARREKQMPLLPETVEAAARGGAPEPKKTTRLTDEDLRAYEQQLGSRVADWTSEDWDWVESDYKHFGAPKVAQPPKRQLELEDLRPDEIAAYEAEFGAKAEDWTENDWARAEADWLKKNFPDDGTGPLMQGEPPRRPKALVVSESFAPTRAGGRPDYRRLLERLRDARVEAGMTQAEVSARLGKPQSYMSKVESGARRLDPIELAAIADAYGKDVGWFYAEGATGEGPLMQGEPPSLERQTAEAAPEGSAIRALMLETAKLSEDLKAMGREAPLYFPFIRQVRPGDVLMNWSFLRRPKNRRLMHSSGKLLATNGYVRDIQQVFRSWNVSNLRQKAFLKVLQGIMSDPSIPKRVWKSGEELAPGEALLPIDFLSRAIMAQRALESGLASSLDRVGLVDESVANTLSTALKASEFQRIAAALETGRVMVVPEAVTKALRHEYSGVPRWMRLAVDKPTSWWVSATLFMRPAWLTNNMLSSAIVNLLAGVGPVEYLQAVQEQFKARTPEDFKFDTAAFQFDAQQPHMGSALDTQLGQLYAWMEQSPPGVLLGNVATLGREANSKIESFFRRALYIRVAKKQARENYLKRTADHFYRAYDQLREIDALTPGQVERAMRDVLYWHNDFSDLSPFERHVVRRVIPFWSFMRWQIQLLSTMPFKHPLRYALMRAASNAYQQAHEEDDERLPEYMRGKGMVYTGATVTAPSGRRMEVWLSTQGWNPFIVGGFNDVGEVKDLGDLEKLVTNQMGPIPQYLVAALTRRGRNDISYTEPGTFESGGRYYRTKEDMVGYRGKALREYPEQGVVEVQAPIPSPVEHYVGSFPQVALARNLANPQSGYTAAPFSLESAKGPNAATEKTRLTEVLRYFGGGSFVLVDPDKAQAWPLSRSTLRSIIRRKAEEEARNRRK